MKFTAYKETKQQGAPDFPLQYYYVNHHHPHYVMPLHWHDHLEVVQILEGKLALYLDDVKHELGAGEVCVIGPGVLHRAEPHDCVYECAVFDLQLAAGQVSSRLSDYIRPLLSSQMEITGNCSQAAGAITALFALLRGTPPYYEWKAVSLIQELMYVLYAGGCIRKAHKQSSCTRHRRALLMQMLNKIERDYAFPIRLKDLAMESGMSEKYLCRFFREFTGKTPTDYINTLRIEHACYEIAVNHRTVTEAAYETGFGELGYFSRVFKKYKGMSPRQYAYSAEDRKNVDIAAKPPVD